MDKHIKRQKKDSFNYVHFIYCCDICLPFLYRKELNHECNGEDCPVCACIQQAQQMLKKLSTGTVVSQVAGLIVVVAVTSVFTRSLFIIKNSPIRQKVRLNN